MRNLFTKYPVISWMSVGYVLYSLLPFIGMAIGDSLGEYGEIFRFSTFLWPYPLILSLQGLIDINSITLLLFYPLGLGLVIIFGHYFQKIFKISDERKWYLYVWLILMWPIPLILLQVVSAAFVWFVLGYPVGE